MNACKIHDKNPRPDVCHDCARAPRPAALPIRLTGERLVRLEYDGPKGVRRVTFLEVAR